MDIAIAHDQERRCGLRHEGTYLVSENNSVSLDGDRAAGSDGETSGLITLNPPLPIVSVRVPRRGYIYTDGAYLLRASRGQLADVPVIDPDIAESNAFSWRAFGMRASDRLGNGLAEDAPTVGAAIRKLSGLEWRDIEAAQHWAAEISLKTDAMRPHYPAVQLYPMVVAARQLYSVIRRGSLPGYVLDGAGATVAASWRLLHAAAWAGMLGTGIRSAVGRVMQSAGAGLDAAYAIRMKIQPARVAPDLVDWVGAQHYPDPQDYIDEARKLGISRRMPGVPKAVVPTWSRAFLAHPRCRFIDGTVGPGIFGWYTISQVQYVLPPDGGLESVPRDIIAGQVVPVRPVVEEAVHG